MEGMQEDETHSGQLMILTGGGEYSNLNGTLPFPISVWSFVITKITASKRSWLIFRIPVVF